MIRCPKCGADHTHLTADVEVTIGCYLDEDGVFRVKPPYEEMYLKSLIQEQCGDVKIFCDNCGCYSDAFYDDDVEKICTCEVYRGEE